MAKKKPSESERIQALVKIQRQGSMFGAGLAVNEGFAAPNEMDRQRGVTPDAPEVEQAERAVGARTLAILMPEKMRVWIWRQARRAGGMPALARELVKVKAIPQRSKPLGKKYKSAEAQYEANLLRAIERSGPETKPGRKEQHGGINQPDYRERIALLILQDLQATIGVIGWWKVIDRDREHDFYEWYYTDPSIPDELAAARRIIAAGGVGMVAYVAEVTERHYVGSGTIQLTTVHGIQAQVDQGRMD